MRKWQIFLPGADIYVSTSLYDGTSVSLLEAMGSGAFPVVTDIPANREWITNGENGFLVPVDEEKYLANRIIDAIRKPRLLERSRIENLSIAERCALACKYRENQESIFTTSRIGMGIATIHSTIKANND